MTDSTVKGQFVSFGLLLVTLHHVQRPERHLRLGGRHAQLPAARLDLGENEAGRVQVAGPVLPGRDPHPHHLGLGPDRQWIAYRQGRRRPWTRHHRRSGAARRRRRFAFALAAASDRVGVLGGLVNLPGRHALDTLRHAGTAEFIAARDGVEDGTAGQAEAEG
ncbi:MAG: hypothetical protein U1F76_20630 [Candidatus Competibacteraceae bacterium]